MLVKNVVEYLDARFPRSNAEEFDQGSIGLAIGSEKIEVSNILLALDLNKEVVIDAISKNCNLIITHHPFLFTGIQKILFDSQKGEVIKLMCENNISLYSMHTNLDVGTGGVNDTLAEMLGINDYKIINDEASKGNYLRYGEIEETSLEQLANNVKKIFNLNGVKVLGDFNKKVKRIGIVGGSGAHTNDILTAVNCGLDCYITGEVHLNNSQLADYYGLSIIEVKHGVEKYVFTSLIEELRKQFLSLYNFDNNIYISNIETDNFNYL